MGRIEVEVPVDKKAVEAALDELTAGTLDDTLTKIAQLASEQEFNQVTIKNLRSNDLWELLDDDGD